MIRVLVSDDHAVLRAGAKEIVLRGFPDAICGEAENGAAGSRAGEKAEMGLGHTGRHDARAEWRRDSW